MTPFVFFPPSPFFHLPNNTHTHTLVEFPAYQAVDASIYNRNLGQHRHPRHPTCPVVNSAELNCYKVQRHPFLSFHNYYFPFHTFVLSFPVMCFTLQSRLLVSPGFEQIAHLLLQVYPFASLPLELLPQGVHAGLVPQLPQFLLWRKQNNTNTGGQKI